MFSRHHLKYSVVFIVLICSVFILINRPRPVQNSQSDIRDERENCRLLGVVSQAPGDTDALKTILKSFCKPTYPQDSGWSLAAYSDYNKGGYLGTPGSPMIIRTQTPILEDRHTWETVSNLFIKLQPETLMGHLRNASSGCSDIADPHPFQRVYQGKTYLMIHNGGIWEKDLEFLKNHLISGMTEPLNCPGTPIDSEYLFIYLMELIEANQGDVWQACFKWCQELSQSLTDDWNALNILLTDGDIIWAVRFSYKSTRFSLQYQSLPENKGWAVSTQALGPDWTPLPNFTLAEFRAGSPVYIEPIPLPLLTGDPEPYGVQFPYSLERQKPE